MFNDKQIGTDRTNFSILCSINMDPPKYHICLRILGVIDYCHDDLLIFEQHIANNIMTIELHTGNAFLCIKVFKVFNYMTSKHCFCPFKSTTEGDRGGRQETLCGWVGGWVRVVTQGDIEPVLWRLTCFRNALHTAGERRRQAEGWGRTSQGHVLCVIPSCLLS